MYNDIVKIKHVLFLYFLLSLTIFLSCNSISSHPKNLRNMDIIYNKNLSNLGTDDIYYIFIRLYYPHYKNTIGLVHFFNKLIIWTDVNQNKFTHIAIGFDLNDNFIGLTTHNKLNLEFEHCTNISTNKYMKKCNPKTSYQTTYTIKVSKEEYEKAKQLTEFFVYSNTIYSMPQTIPIVFFELKRKFFTEQENQKLKNINSKKNKKNKDEDEVPLEFVCSNFVAYILINSVDSIKVFFEENNLDYKYIIPSDIPYFPGTTKLFSSNWNNYTKAALAYVKSENNIFAQKKLPNQN